MTMYDIETPTESYAKEVKKLKGQIKQLDDNVELNSSDWSFKNCNLIIF